MSNISTTNYRLLSTLVGHHKEEIQHRVTHIVVPDQLILKRGEELQVKPEIMIQRAQNSGRLFPGKLGFETEIETLLAANKNIATQPVIIEETGPWKLILFVIIAAAVMLIAILGLYYYLRSCKKSCSRLCIRGDEESPAEEEHQDNEQHPPQPVPRVIYRLRPEERIVLPSTSTTCEVHI